MAMTASSITWEDLRNISSEGKAELRAAGLSPETGQALQAFGYTQAGDLQYITDQLQSVCVGLPIIQAAKLRELVGGAPLTSAPRAAAGATAARTMQPAGQPSKPCKHSQHQLLPAHVFDTARRLKPSPYSLEVTVLSEDCGGIPGLVDMLSSKDEAAVTQAAWALTNLAAGNNDQRDSICSAGAVGPLVALLSGGSQDVQEQAAWVLRTLMENSAAKPVRQLLKSDFTTQEAADKAAAAELAEQGDSHKHRAEVAQAGAIAPLIALLSRGPEGAQEHAAGALLSLAVSSDKWMARIVAAGAMPPLVAMLSGGDAGGQAQAARTIRGMQRASAAPVADHWTIDPVSERIVALNAIEPLVALLSSGSQAAQADVAWVLFSAIKDEKMAERIEAAGAISPLVALLSSENTYVQEAAVHAVDELALHSKRCCAKILEAGAMAPLEFLRFSHIDVTTNVTAELSSHLCEVDPGAYDAAVLEGGQQLSKLLVAHLSNGDERMQEQAAECLIQNITPEQHDAYSEYRSSSADYADLARRASLSAGSDRYEDLARRAVAGGAIAPLVALSRGYRKASDSARKALRALARGSEERRDAVIAAGGQHALEGESDGEDKNQW